MRFSTLSTFTNLHGGATVFLFLVCFFSFLIYAEDILRLWHLRRFFLQHYSTLLLERPRDIETSHRRI
jgi:hypothetical protein